MNDLTFLGIDHPGVAADDVEQLANWYCAVFGYEKWFEHRNRPGGPADPDRVVWMLRAPDGTLLEIMPEDNTARPERTTAPAARLDARLVAHRPAGRRHRQSQHFSRYQRRNLG